tara:strand:- start:8444 stop:9037 length:594 start_codon:yes stop_codon:yes gene_type:complete
MVFASYIPLFFLASIPIKGVLNWLFPDKTPDKVPHINGTKYIMLFIFSHISNFLIGLGGAYTIEQLFFYEYPFFTYLGIAILTVGYFWSFLKHFNPAGNISTFILGILVYHTIHFLWFYSLITLLLILLTNHVSMGIFLSLLTTYFGIIIFDLNETFIITNTIIIILFILRKNKSLTNFFSSKPTTITQQFHNRNYH